MAVFTTISKQKLSWPSPPTVSRASEYVLRIGGGFDLLIGGGFKLIIQPGETETQWTPITKSQYS